MSLEQLQVEFWENYPFNKNRKILKEKVSEYPTEGCTSSVNIFALHTIWSAKSHLGRESAQAISRLQKKRLINLNLVEDSKQPKMKSREGTNQAPKNTNECISTTPTRQTDQ